LNAHDYEDRLTDFNEMLSVATEVKIYLDCHHNLTTLIITKLNTPTQATFRLSRNLRFNSFKAA